MRDTLPSYPVAPFYLGSLPRDTLKMPDLMSHPPSHPSRRLNLMSGDFIDLLEGQKGVLQSGRALG